MPATLSVFFACLGSGLAGAYASAHALELGLPSAGPWVYSTVLFGLFLAMGWIARACGAGRSAYFWRILSLGLCFMPLLLSPIFERLSLPAPHDLLERKRQILFAACAMAALMGMAVVQVSALRWRLALGSSAGAWVLILPFAWLLLSAVWTTPWNMTGDAPHYLLITHSLVHDGDLDLANNYAQGDAAAFYPRMPLVPQETLVNGRMISWHRPGLPFLLAPAYAWGGPYLAVVSLCFLSALLAGSMWALLQCTGLDTGRCLWAWAAVTLSPPFMTQGAMALAEIPAALMLTLAIWGLLRLPDKPAAALALGFAMMALPWLNGRYNVLMLPLVLALLWQGRRHPARMAVALLGAAGGLLSQAAFTWVNFGSLSPAAGHGDAQHALTESYLNIRYLKQAGLGQLWDQEFGLAFTAPFWLLGLVGLVRAWSNGRRLAGLCLALFAANYAVLSCWFAWQGQLSPNRFYTPLLPVLALGLVWTAPRQGGPLNWPWRLAAGASLGLSWAYLALPWFAFNRGDGANWLFKVLGARLHVDLAQVLPSFQAPGPRDFAWGVLLSALLARALFKAARAEGGAE